MLCTAWTSVERITVPIIPFFTDLIKFLIPLPITIPFPYLDLALNLTPPDSISRPQEPNSDSPEDQSISIPQKEYYFSFV